MTEIKKPDIRSYHPEMSGEILINCEEKAFHKEDGCFVI